LTGAMFTDPANCDESKKYADEMADKLFELRKDKGMTPEKATQFGWASGALATTVLEDYAVPVDEEMVWSIYEGNARVKR